MIMTHIEKSEHCLKCKKSYDQHEYDMQYCNSCSTKNHRYPDFIDIRRINEKPTGIEIVFGDVDNPTKRYVQETPLNKVAPELLKALEHIAFDDIFDLKMKEIAKEAIAKTRGQP